VAAHLSEAALAGSMTPGGGATPYADGSKTPAAAGYGFDDVAWSPLAQGGPEDTYGGSTSCE